MSKITPQQQTERRRKYEQDLYKYLNSQNNETLISLRNGATSHHRRRACEAVMRRRGMLT